MQRNVEGCRKIQSNAEKFREMHRNADKCRDIIKRNKEKSREIQRYEEKCTGRFFNCPPKKKKMSKCWPVSNFFFRKK